MKTIIAALIIAALVLPASAVAGNLSVGVKGGAVTSRVTVDYHLIGPEKQSRYTGWSVGAILEYQMGRLVAARLAPGYNQRGLEMEVTTYARVSDSTVSAYLGYLSLPLNLRFRIPLRPVEPYLLAGPRLDILLHRHGGQYARVYFDRIDDVSFGYTLGGGLEWSARPNLSVFGEVTYDGDIGSIDAEPGFDVIIGAIDVSAGVRLGL